MKKLNILNKAFDIIFIIFLLICLFAVIIPFLFRVKLYYIASESMKPNINIGDLVVTKDININKLKEKDVIAFKYNDIVITHRIKKIDNEGITTKGDNNTYEDISKVTSDQVIGKIILIIPFLGNVYSFIIKNSLLICVVILIFGAMLNYLNKKENKKR